MASVRRDQLPSSSATEGSCLSRVATNTIVGLGVGVLATVVGMAFKAPSTNPRHNVAKAFRALAYDVVPMTTIGAVLYTSVSCITESSRMKQDWRNPAMGGAAAGAFVLGARKRSAVAAGVGAGLFGLAAAAPHFAADMAPSPEEAKGSLAASTAAALPVNNFTRSVPTPKMQ